MVVVELALVYLRLRVAAYYTIINVALPCILHEVISHLVLMGHRVAHMIIDFVEGVHVMHLHVICLAKLIREADIPMLYQLVVVRIFVSCIVFLLVTIRW